MGKNRKRRRKLVAPESDRCSNHVTLSDGKNGRRFPCVRWNNHRGSCYAGEIPGYHRIVSLLEIWKKEEKRDGSF